MGDRLVNKVGSKICARKVWFALLKLRSIGIEDENNKGNLKFIGGLRSAIVKRKKKVQPIHNQDFKNP
jgi:hypothetical protein